MDKETLLKVIVVGAILLFVLEPIAISLLHSSPQGGQYYRGNATVIAKLISYGNYIVVDGKVGNISSAKSITYVGGKSLVETNNTYETYKEVKKLGLRGESDAYFSLETAIVGDKVLNGSATFRLKIEPLIRPGVLVKGSALVIFDDKGNIKDAAYFTPVLEEKTVNATFEVKKLIGKIYRYVVDWNNRSLAKNYTNITNVVYINTTEKAPFVSYVGDGYIIVDDSTKREDVLNYYNTTAYFPDVIITSDKPLNISFAKNESVEYKYLIYAKDYDLERTYTSEKPLSIGENITLSIEGVFSGDVFLFSKD